MDVINLLPSPPHFFRLFFRLAYSLFNSTVNATHRKVVAERRSLVDFDIDVDTGFFPRRPLQRLPAKFEIWERALAEANAYLSLGEDQSDEAMRKRPAGEAWRCNIRAVGALNLNMKAFLTICLLFSGRFLIRKVSRLIAVSSSVPTSYWRGLYTSTCIPCHHSKTATQFSFQSP